jgi:hypothetical protein
MWQGWHDENQIRMRLERELKQLTTVFHRVVSERNSLKEERDELEEENKTIGIVLCKDKKDTMVEITLPENNEQIFASKYELILPSKKELQKLIESKNN